MKLAKFLFLCLGLALLYLVLRDASLPEIGQALRALGWPVLLLVLVIYSLSFWMDVASWHVILDSLPFKPRWSARLFAIRMIGEAYNNATPAASVGGEPVKAWLLKSHCRIGLREAGGSLVLAKTVIVMSLVPFVAVACLLVLLDARLSPEFGLPAAMGLGVLVLLAVAFFLTQRLKLSSVLARRLGRSPLGQRVSGLAAVAEDLDAQFLRFYSGHRARLLLSLVTAFGAWLFGVAEVWLVMRLLGYPVGWSEAWIIEALVQLVRTITFVIPANIGAQEAAFYFLCGAITGNPQAGLAFALVRRGRDLIWIALGLLLGLRYSVSRRPVADQSGA